MQNGPENKIKIDLIANYETLFFLSLAVLHLIKGFHNFSKKLKSTMSLTPYKSTGFHSSFTYSKLNMDEICGLKSYVL